MVFTATAKIETRKYLIEKLEMKNSQVFERNPDRPNIKYIKVKRQTVLEQHNNFQNVLDTLALELIEQQGQFPVTILYTNLELISFGYTYLEYKMKECNGETDSKIGLFAQYHRFYTTSMKDAIIKELGSGSPKCRLIFATIALGMGLDAPNVRRVIHFGAPTTLSNYLQETGRAGRDGKPSEAILYWNQTDVRSNRPGFDKSLRAYCETEGQCLRYMLLEHQGFTLDVNRQVL